MKKPKKYKIFALIYRKRMYIGKTFSRRVSAVYQRHCRGELKSTRVLASEGKPELHLLYKEEMQDHEAYRYVLAYINIFERVGYQILNCQRTIDSSKDLHSETRAIVKRLDTEDISTLLSRTFVENIYDADDFPLIPEKYLESEKAEQKLTIRLAQSEKEEYMRIGAELSLNQRETLQYLFAKAKQADSAFLDLEGDSYLRALINSYREENEKLKKLNAELGEKVVTIRADKRNRLERKNEQITEIKKGIQQYFAMMESTCKIPLGLEVGQYEEFVQAGQYKYPDKAGCYIFRPQEILRGKGRWGALFILGIGDGKTLYKVRFFPKDYYLGLSFRNVVFAKRGSVWLIGCEQASDGAMDLIFAFPLEVQFRYNGPEEYGSEANRFVADLLKEIESYQDS